jgi:DNA-directed RNA polymerase subunit RPC12/RpoP
MSSLFRSGNRLQKTHGWDVELTCGQCGATTVPRFEGWSPALSTNLGPHVQVYAKVACPKCGSRLTDQAGRELTELFRDLDIPPKNKSVITQFVTRLFLIPAGLAFVIFFGMQMDWWGWGLGTVWVLLVSAVAVPLLVLSRNRQIAALPGRCECGKPHYVFMGTLDGSYCYRCFSCGRLMKLRE